MSTLKIAVLGTGMMGLPMARRLAQAGHEVHAWNRTRAKADQLVADGVTIHDNAADAVLGVDFAVSLLESGAIVGEVLFNLGVADAMPKGSLFIDMASIQPREAREHASKLNALGCSTLMPPSPAAH